MGCYNWYQSRSVCPASVSNIVYPLVRDKCVQHCRYLLFSSRLVAGVGLKQVGEKLVLLLDVSSVNSWFGVL